MGSAFALAVAVPATALADMATDPETPDMTGVHSCMSVCSQPTTSETTGASREDVRQAADQDHAQARYQLGSGQPEWVAPDHPYSQGHYQLGAGHQD
jgi:hypothetical protein